MNILYDNPFRILGLSGNSLEKDLQRQISIIKRYAEIGKKTSFETDLKFLGEISRDHDSVQKAASKLEQAAEKVFYSIFWFFNNNHIDEVALEHLKNGNVTKAQEIWEEVARDDAVTIKNLSAKINLSTLFLGLMISETEITGKGLAKSLSLKGQVISSDLFSTLVEMVAGKNSSVKREIIYRRFAEEAYHLFEVLKNKTKDFSGKQILSVLDSLPEETRRYLTYKLTETSINRIEKQIGVTRERREEEPFDAEVFGRGLFQNTEADFYFIRDVLTSESIQFQLICDNLALELNQCAVDFFNEMIQSDEFDPVDKALGVLDKACQLDPSEPVREKIEVNKKEIKKWGQERQKFQRIKYDVYCVGEYLEIFVENEGRNGTRTATDLVQKCKPKLKKIERVVGKKDKTYLTMSSAVVNNAMKASISEVNSMLEQLDKRHPDRFKLREAIHASKALMSSISNMDMEFELRNNFLINLESIDKLVLEINNALPAPYRTRPVYSGNKPATSPAFLSNIGDGAGNINWTPWVIAVLIIGFPAICLISNAIAPPSRNSSAIQSSEIKSKSNYSTSSPTGELKPKPLEITRPKNGENLVTPGSGSGRGSLKIKNDSGLDAIAKLVENGSGKTYRQVYIHRGTTQTVSGLKTGTFELKFSLGEDYSPSRKGFTINEKYHKFDSPLIFSTTKSRDGLRWNYYEVSLTPVKYGNATTTSISEGDFADK